MGIDIDPVWAWEPYRPSAESPWDLKKVGHLYRRAAFGANWSELQTSLQAGPEKTIDTLLMSRLPVSRRASAGPITADRRAPGGCTGCSTLRIRWSRN